MKLMPPGPDLPSRGARAGYLREAGAAVLLQLLEGASARMLATVLDGAPAFADWLCSPLEVWLLLRRPVTPPIVTHSLIRAQSADAEAVYMALELADKLPSSAAARCAVLPRAGLARLFDRAHITALLPALLASTAAHPRVHSVWATLVKLLSRRAAHAQPAAANPAVESFWSVACEGSLFTSSHERKCVTHAVAPCAAVRRYNNRRCRPVTGS